MHVHTLGWIGLAAIVLTLITIDFVGHTRKSHAPSLKEAAIWSGFYIFLAASFGVMVWAIYGSHYAAQYYAGWLTEWSLSVDNLFVFIIILGAFRVPREYQQKALLFGIATALILRLIFILLGAALIEHFSWVFYFFGAFLLWTAYSQAKESGGSEEDDEYEENQFTRIIRKVLPTTDGFVGDKLFHRVNHRTYVTPLFIAIIALGSADIMFAFDSIPAIFGLTQEPYLVFAANAFALLGLRQLFFLIDGLLERLIYLNYGLAIILGFIGLKLINHALHHNEIPFINGGHPITAIPEPSTMLSLGVIVVTLVLTAVTSLLATRGQDQVTKA
ncbi:TerC family protein [Actinomyces vulturis]|uniref:TerC family protein n=1 Tax=Actinomyces vulturis TaxID=1857645 RepID=UPI00082CB430|nr:TerC family protein [Actinomyces vulturis]